MSADRASGRHLRCVLDEARQTTAAGQSWKQAREPGSYGPISQIRSDFIDTNQMYRDFNLSGRCDINISDILRPPKV